MYLMPPVAGAGRLAGDRRALHRDQAARRGDHARRRGAGAVRVDGRSATRCATPFPRWTDAPGYHRAGFRCFRSFLGRSLNGKQVPPPRANACAAPAPVSGYTTISVPLRAHTRGKAMVAQRRRVACGPRARIPACLAQPPVSSVAGSCQQRSLRGRWLLGVHAMHSVRRRPSALRGLGLLLSPPSLRFPAPPSRRTCQPVVVTATRTPQPVDHRAGRHARDRRRHHRARRRA